MTNPIPVKDVTPPPPGGDKPVFRTREKIYARWITGRFQKLSDFTLTATMGVFLVTPWVSWNGIPLVHFNLPERRFDILGLTFFPEDFFLLSLLLMVAAFGLLFITNLLGRVFCGYVCPQTVWSRFFSRIERITEGDRGARQKLDKADMSAEKILRRSIKHVLWLGLALLTAVTFVGYFSPIQDLALRLFTLELGPWEAWWIFFFTAATYINAGWMREQICVTLCPYGRFQSVMFDRNTLLVSYDPGRGEPRTRGAKRRESGDNPFGDCIDDKLCVQVCPTGIDIRDGLQYECIACAACIDACDAVMDSIGKPRGLVRYTTENSLEGQVTKIIRPRLLGYGAVLAILATFLFAGVLMRQPVDLDVVRDRNALFQETSEGLLENVYTLKVANMGQNPRTFLISLEAPEGISYRGPQAILLGGGAMESLPVSLVLDPNLTKPVNADIHFQVQAQDNPSVQKRIESRFISVGR